MSPGAPTLRPGSPRPRWASAARDRRRRSRRRGPARARANAAWIAQPLHTWQWSGAYGHHFWVDPGAKLTVVVLTNTAFAGMVGELPDAVRRAVQGPAQP
ncbi:serine hydrolase [Sorangium sp. So ce176]|uniref:serine hydrolase n=1 Tax=Sorangium sp. So ce176 TaxID=3133286 RepID=UPI003F60A763